MQLFFLVIFMPLITLWISLCGVLSLFGYVVRRRGRALSLHQVLTSMTVCRVLFEKGCLSKIDYDFETKEVASLYNDNVFKGYLFIFVPLMPALKKTSFLDGLMTYLVKQWMEVHRFILGKTSWAPLWKRVLVQFCVTIALYLGRLLYLFSNKSETDRVVNYVP